MEKVAEVPQRYHSAAAVVGEVVRRVVAAEQLHAHDGEDEDDDGQHEAQVAESAERSADNTHQQVQRRPRLGQLEHAQLLYIQPTEVTQCQQRLTTLCLA